MNTLKFLWVNHRKLLVALLVSLAFVIYFSVRLLAFFIYWADPDHRDQELAGWMTPRYVIQSWDVPKKIVRDVVGPPSEGRRQRLSDIADERGVPLDVVIAELMAAIQKYRAQ